MPGGFCGLYRNTRGARVARGEIKPDAQRERLETEAERVKAWLRAKREEIRGQHEATPELRDTLRVMHWLTQYALYLERDAMSETHEEFYIPGGGGVEEHFVYDR